MILPPLVNVFPPSGLQFMEEQAPLIVVLLLHCFFLFLAFFDKTSTFLAEYCADIEHYCGLLQVLQKVHTCVEVNGHFLH